MRSSAFEIDDMHHHEKANRSNFWIDCPRAMKKCCAYFSCKNRKRYKKYDSSGKN